MTVLRRNSGNSRFCLVLDLNDLSERQCVLVVASAACAWEERCRAGMVMPKFQPGDQVALPDVLQRCSDLVQVLGSAGAKTVVVLEMLQSKRSGSGRLELILYVNSLTA